MFGIGKLLMSLVYRQYAKLFQHLTSNIKFPFILTIAIFLSNNKYNIVFIANVLLFHSSL